MQDGCCAIEVEEALYKERPTLSCDTATRSSLVLYVSCRMDDYGGGGERMEVARGWRRERGEREERACSWPCSLSPFFYSLLNYLTTVTSLPSPHYLTTTLIFAEPLTSRG